MNTIALPSDIVAQMKMLFDTHPLEGAGILLCRALHGPKGVRLLGFEFAAYDVADYLVQERDRLSIAPVAVNRFLQRAREQSLCVVQVHTHPGSQHAGFSEVDDEGEHEMVPVIFRRAPGGPHGAIVLGTHTWAARIYTDPQTPAAARILEVGQDLQRLDLVSGESDQRFNRSALALGASGQAALRDLRVGVVGLGGTGSIAAQELAYLGVRDVAFIDPDVVEVTNLNRLVGATHADLGTPKVDVAAQRYREVEPSATIAAHRGDVLDEQIARTLFDRDIVLCCTDSQGSRALLNWLAYQCFMPIIDMGVEITAEAGAVIGIAGRVQLAGPGMPCLHCCNVVDLNALRVELLSEEQRARDPYVVGEHVAQPAVISFNATMVSLAITMFMAMSTSLPMRARMQTYYGLRGEVRSATASVKDGCPICSTQSEVYGRAESLVPMWRSALPAVASR